MDRRRRRVHVDDAMTRSWTREDFRRWVEALTLAAECWLADVLLSLGIRPALASRHELFEVLRDEAIAQGSHWSREDDPAIAAAAGSALRQLAAASSVDDAKSFQRWSRRHFICRDAPIALFVWRQVLRHSSRPAGGMYVRVPPPEPIAAAVDQAAKLVSDEQTKLVEDRIGALAPPLSESDIEIGLDLPSQALAAIEVVRGEATATALVRLATSFTADERKLVARWGEMQAAALNIPPDRLGGERFISEEPACADAPPAVIIEYPR